MKESSRRKRLSQAKRGVVGTIFLILVLTVLEFPAPIGFETRSQSDVSVVWFLLFLAILGFEISAMMLIFKRPKLGAPLAIVAAGLNLFQIVADQVHLMQPEVATLGYSLLEYSVGVLALALIYFAWKVRKITLQ